MKRQIYVFDVVGARSQTRPVFNGSGLRRGVVLDPPWLQQLEKRQFQEQKTKTASTAGGSQTTPLRENLSMKKLFLLFTVFLLAFSLSACTKEPVKKPPIKIGLDVWAGYAYVFIAQEKGFFKKNGVDVTLVLMKNPLEVRAAFKNREMDGMFGLISDMIMLNSEGTPAKMIYASDQSVTADALIGLSRFKSLKELKGKTVSFEGINSFSHIFVLKLLENAGLKESEVKFKDVNASDVLKALEKGEIDAGHTWEPHLSEARQKGYKALAKSSDLPGVIMAVLFFNPKIINERSAEVMAIVKSLFEARDFVNSNRDEALGIMATAEGMTKEAMEVGIKGIVQFDLKTNYELFKMGGDKKTFNDFYKTTVDFYMARGQMSKAPEFESIVEPGFVRRLFEEKSDK